MLKEILQHICLGILAIGIFLISTIVFFATLVVLVKLMEFLEIQETAYVTVCIGGALIYSLYNSYRIYHFFMRLYKDLKYDTFERNRV